MQILELYQFSNERSCHRRHLTRDIDRPITSADLLQLPEFNILLDDKALPSGGRAHVIIQANFNKVPKVGVEPTLPKEHEFESCASASSATSANA